MCGDIYKGETGFRAHTDHRGDPESVVFSVSNTGTSTDVETNLGGGADLQHESEFGSNY